jgi:hypothetical protein
VTSDSAKNASGQEAFGCRGREALVEQSPAVSTAEVSSQALGAGATVASEVEKGATSTTPPVGGQQDDLCVSDPPTTLGQQAAEVGDTDVEVDDNRCLYAGTPWENDVVIDRRNVYDFKEESRMIARMLSVRAQPL